MSKRHTVVLCVVLSVCTPYATSQNATQPPSEPQPAQSTLASSLTLPANDRIASVVFSPDGRHILTFGYRGARVWNASTGQLLAVFRPKEKGIGLPTGAVFSPDGRRILTVNDDARVWEAASGRLLATLSQTDNLNSAVFSPDGRHILTAGMDHTARVWDAESFEPLFTMEGHTDPLSAALYSPDGRRILTACWDVKVRLWDAGSGELLATLPGGGYSIKNEGFSPDGRRIFTNSDAYVRVWDADSGQLLATVEDSLGFLDAAFSPDSRSIVTVARRPAAGVWDAATGQELAAFAVTGYWAAVSTAVFSPDGRRVVTAGAHGTVQVWDAATGQLLANLRGHKHDVRIAVFSPDGRRLATASPEDGAARVWNVGKLLAASR